MSSPTDPSSSPRPAIENVDELGALAVLRFPHRDDVEVVLLHDAHRVVAEAVVEGLLVVVEDLVDAELMDGRGGEVARVGRAEGRPVAVGLKPDLQRSRKRREPGIGSPPDIDGRNNDCRQPRFREVRTLEATSG